MIRSVSSHRGEIIKLTMSRSRLRAASCALLSSFPDVSRPFIFLVYLSFSPLFFSLFLLFACSSFFGALMHWISFNDDRRLVSSLVKDQTLGNKQITWFTRNATTFSRNADTGKISRRRRFLGWLLVDFCLSNIFIYYCRYFIDFANCTK